MGKELVENIRYFGERGKIFMAHFRNVDRPFPHFVETFVDGRYGDMHKLLRELAEVGFEGVLIPDHIPQMGGDGRIGAGYTLGWMKAAGPG